MFKRFLFSVAISFALAISLDAHASLNCRAAIAELTGKWIFDSFADYQAMQTRADLLALEKHRGQIYDTKKNRSYDYHLDSVVRILRESGLDPQSTTTEFAHFSRIALIVARLHDVVEDTPVTITEIKARFGVEVAEAVYAVTKASKPDNYERLTDAEKSQVKRALAQATLEKLMRGSNVGRMVKLADRIANVEYGRDEEPSGINPKYFTEQPEFRVLQQIWHSSRDSFSHLVYLELWLRLNSALSN